MSRSAGFAVLPVLLASMWLGGLTGCYAPRALPEGAPCERSEQCPESQQCVLGSCSLRAPPPTDAPAPPSDAPADAPIDAMPLPCSTAGLSCNGTVTMFLCGANCWTRCSASVVRETARAACAGWMGALGEIDNQADQDCLNARIGGVLTIWVGMIQNNDPANTPSTGWTWNGVHPVTYTNWAAGQPDDAGGGEKGAEQCMVLRTDGTWADDPCTNSRGFFCERP
ncbi:MAG TPA: C-type lectin domain-containing protein [Kofleriaceae bacterium]|jgi:hypothetical protein|nr:C-type lectin domain-containing protein [Kofleriaceae bacterium]